MKKLGFVSLLLLAGCQTVFTKPGATAYDFQQDKAACEYEAMKYAGGYDQSLGTIGQGIDLGMRRNEITRACLQQKGWQKQ